MIKYLLLYGFQRVEWCVLLDGICYITIVLNDGAELSFTIGSMSEEYKQIVISE